jgi:stalled ribosome rescue protein Dom34
LIVAGPGNTKLKFIDFLKENNIKLKTYKLNIQNVSKSSINEVFSKKQISNIFKDSILFKEQEILNTFKENLGKNNNKAIYGLKEVNQYVITGAIESILISEHLWKRDTDNIQKIILTAEKIKTKVHVIDSSHNEIISAIDSFGGIIANLRYNIY